MTITEHAYTLITQKSMVTKQLTSRKPLGDFTFGHDDGKERWKCCHFTLNVCKMLALPFLERSKTLVDELPDPTAQLFTNFEDIAGHSSQNYAGTAES